MLFNRLTRLIIRITNDYLKGLVLAGVMGNFHVTALKALPVSSPLSFEIILPNESYISESALTDVVRAIRIQFVRVNYFR